VVKFVGSDNFGLWKTRVTICWLSKGALKALQEKQLDKMEDED
jgi:hypothetical protein